jgi:signal transduction histidine kinase
MEAYFMQQFKNFRITTKFILWFLLISLVPLSISIYVSYQSSRKALKQEVANSLFAVADNKANQIESYLLMQKQNGITLSSMPEVISAFDRYKGGELDYETIAEEYISILKYYQKLFGYDDIFLVNPDGEIILSGEGIKGAKSLYELALSKKSELTDVFMRAKASQDTEISNFEFYPLDKTATVFIASPVFKEGGLIGLVILKMSNIGLYSFVQDYIGLGETGETIIVSKRDNQAVFVTPLRFDSQEEFAKKIKIGLRFEESDFEQALRGEIGSGISIDYRGRQVLAVRRYLPTFRLGMVVKMDTAEVFASAAKLRNTLLGISVALLVMVVIMALVIAYSISRPIKELTGISKIISAGDLTARVVINNKDEIGELASSFNQMTDKLVASKINVEQKKIELEEQKRLLEQVNRELDSFVYTVSHDLRAPLRGIDGLISFIEQDYIDKLDSQGKDYLEKIRTSANRMKALIDDLLKLSRITRIKNPFEDVNINELITSVIARIEFDIKEHNVELKIAPDLPVIRCDKIKMEEAFLNLINNAVKFSKKFQGSNPCVEIGYSDINEAHQFYVKDNGIGIDEKYHEEIFGIFKRLHKQSEYEGTGAGLSIVKRIIEDHKGSIWVDSQLGKGATFYFTIPKGL